MRFQTVNLKRKQIVISILLSHIVFSCGFRSRTKKKLRGLHRLCKQIYCCAPQWELLWVFVCLYSCIPFTGVIEWLRSKQPIIKIVHTFSCYIRGISKFQFISFFLSSPFVAHCASCYKSDTKKPEQNINWKRKKKRKRRISLADRNRKKKNKNIFNEFVGKVKQKHAAKKCKCKL